MEAAIIKVYPSVEECKINNLMTCPTEGCQNVFTSESNLTLHLAKTHKNVDAKKSMQKTDVKHYYCPEVNCSKFFKNMKFLRQHYLKVHTQKDYFCFTCEKTFASENMRNDHRQYCGVKFQCCDCVTSYDAYESLQTHSRRKKHNILDKKCYIPCSTKTSSDTNINVNKFILPRVSGSFHLVVLPTKRAMVHQECQTVGEKPLLESKMTQIYMLVPQSTQQTQTGSRNEQLHVETQTVRNFFGKKEMSQNDNDQKSAKTQTDNVESTTASCNTSFNMEDFEFAFKNDVQKNSSATQTQNELQNIYSISTATHDSIHTDTLDLLSDSLNDNLSNFDSNFFNCHMETQTDDMLNHELFSCDYYSHMCTQTCDEILSDVGFCDTQTQTAFFDRLRSVESQTALSQNRMSCKDMSHMETQTDVEFRQMLEIINS